MDAAETLSQAAALLNAKSPQAAADLLQRLLATQPDHPDALQLYGLALKNTGQLEQARDAMAASLQAAPNQPHVLNNLGGVQLRLDQIEQARINFERAVALQPSYKEAWRNLALAQRRLGDLDAAGRAIRQALALDAHFAAAQETLGQILLERGESAKAITTLQSAAALRPNSASAWRLLGAAHRAARAVPQALAALQRASVLDPEGAEIHALLGAVHEAAGDDETARGAYERALTLNPEYQDAHFALSQNRWRNGETADALASYRRAAELRPNSAAIACGHAQTLLFLERFADAESVLRDAAAHNPQDARIQHLLGRVLTQTGQHAESIARLSGVIKEQPNTPALRISLARAHIGAGDFQAALGELGLCDPDLSHAQELEQGILALRFVCAKQLGLPEAAQLYDYNAFVCAAEIPTPPGFASLDAFNAALAERLVTLHTSAREPIEQSLRGGTQTLGRLFETPDPLIQALRQSCEQTIERYRRELPDLGAHPFQRRRPEAARFAGSWSVRLKGGGFHKNHFHSRGWLSSAYYVALPRELADSARQGWLKFGQPHDLAGADAPPEYWIKPEPGLLALFPSYMWHGTEPFASAQTRLTVAFDVQSNAPTRGQLSAL